MSSLTSSPIWSYIVTNIMSKFGKNIDELKLDAPPVKPKEKDIQINAYATTFMKELYHYLHDTKRRDYEFIIPDHLEKEEHLQKKVTFSKIISLANVYIIHEDVSVKRAAQIVRLLYQIAFLHKDMEKLKIWIPLIEKNEADLNLRKNKVL